MYWEFHDYQSTSEFENIGLAGTEFIWSEDQN